MGKLHGRSVYDLSLTERIQRRELLHQIIVEPGGGKTFYFYDLHGNFPLYLEIECVFESFLL